MSGRVRLHRTCKKLRKESYRVELLLGETGNLQSPNSGLVFVSSRGEGSGSIASSIVSIVSIIAGSGSESVRLDCLVCEPGLVVPIDSSDSIVGNMSDLEHDIIEEVEEKSK